jgi:hypothetical protein
MPLLHFRSEVPDRPRHVLFRGADRNPEMSGDIGEAPTFEPPEDEHRPRALGQRQQRAGCGMKLFLPTKDALGIDIRIPVQFGVERNVILGTMRRAATPAIGKHVGRDPQDITVKIADRLGAAPRDDPGEDFLDEVLDVCGVSGPPLEETHEPAADRLGLSRQRVNRGRERAAIHRGAFFHNMRADAIDNRRPRPRPCPAAASAEFFPKRVMGEPGR